MSRTAQRTPLTIPALRGTFGNWIYYSCLMPIRELGTRTDYATELHSAEAEELSRMIQRALEGHRAVEIAHYLTCNEDRFFNSLVLAVYGGKPDWLEIGIKGTETPSASLSELSEEAKDSIGFLRLSGREKLFAIDGQHRLSGIKHAMDGDALIDEFVPVILVGHTNTPSGMRRTRRLFTTLNKTAVPVTKRDIIALDEDDVMAITARGLYEEDERFSKRRIAIITTNNLPPASEALTTIGNLYDVLKLIFMHKIGKSQDAVLRFNRPSDESLLQYRNTAEAYFTALAKAFPPLNEYYRASNPSRVARKYRSDAGGHILFRPIGLELITRAVVAVAKENKVGLEEAIPLVSKVETQLEKKPYTGVIWDGGRGTIISKGKSLARRLLFYMLRLPCDEQTLLGDYRKFQGRDEQDVALKLPRRVI
jgi:DNA sulfur modification protein DndB